MSSGKLGGSPFGEAISRDQSADGGGLDLVNEGREAERWGWQLVSQPHQSE